MNKLKKNRIKDLKTNNVVDLRQNDPEAILEKAINRNVKLQFLEYLSAAACFGGTVAVGVLGPNATVFAAAPLTFSVCLNLFNRRQLDQLTRQHTRVDTTEIQTQLNNDIQTLRNDFQALPEVREAIDMSELQAALSAVSESVTALEEKALSPVSETGEPQTELTAEMDQLRAHQIELAEALESVRQQLANTPETGAVAGPDLSGELATLRASIAQLEQRGVGNDSEAAVPNLEPLQAELATLRDSITHLEQRGVGNDSEAVVPNLEPLRAELQAMLTPVQSQVSALNDRLHNQPSLESESPTNTSEQVIEIQGHLEGLNTKVDNAFVNLSDELAAVRGAVEGTQGQIEGVKQQLGEDISGIRGAVEGAQGQIEGVKQQLGEDISGMRGAVEHTQGQVNGLQEQLAAGQQGQQEQPDPQQIELQVQAALTPIKEHLTSLDGKIQAIPSVDSEVIQGQSDQLQALQGQLHSMGTRIDNVSAQVSTEMSNLPHLVEEKVKGKLDSQPPAPKPEEEKKANKLFELDALLADLES